MTAALFIRRLHVRLSVQRHGWRPHLYVATGADAPDPADKLQVGLSLPGVSVWFTVAWFPQAEASSLRVWRCIKEGSHAAAAQH